MLFPRRLHAIELLDIPRCPRVIRDGATDYLQFIIRSGHAYGPIVQPLAQALRAQGSQQVVDLCSGAGGPWPDLRQELVKAGASASLRVTLTDLYPNLQAFANCSARDAAVTGNASSIDLEKQTLAVPGLRTCFSAFHHFTPAMAAKVLRHMAHGGDGIFIAEVTQRSLGAMFFMLFAPLFVWLATPLLRPFTWTRLLFTYVIPAIPFAVCFDGIISCFRTYSPSELEVLFRSVEDLNYEWQVGLARGRGLLPVTYAIGFPRNREG